MFKAIQDLSTPHVPIYYLLPIHRLSGRNHLNQGPLLVPPFIFKFMLCLLHFGAVLKPDLPYFQDNNLRESTQNRISGVNSFRTPSDIFAEPA